MGYKRKITIINSTRPVNDNVNDKLQWLCNSLGLFGTRDRDKSCYRMFVILLRGLKRKKEFTSDEIAQRVGLTRGTVVHHLHKLMDSGLVVSRDGKYILRVENLSDLIDELERDILKTITKLKGVAEELDDKLSL